jgi:ABC-type lipoprotein export system ATPase subunit
VPFRECGSLWGRWDLHFHTPASFDYKNKSVTNTEIVEGLKAAGVEVVAITDHHTIDVARIRDLQRLAGKTLTIMPGIEFRTELGGKEKVHLIGIFPENSHIDDLWTKLSGKLELTPEDVIRKGGDESIYVDFREAAELIRQLGGIVTTHAGGKSNSIENIPNNSPFKMALKTDLARECVDLYEVGRPSDCEGYERIVFPAIKCRLPLIMGSDNHDISHYDVKAICWIKGDPSFQTFQQLRSDPQRASLSPSPGETNRIVSNPTKYISEVTFTKLTGTRVDDDWFSGTVQLNPGLVAIIGNKGSGKTALAEVIGLLGNCESADSFSFLNEKKFRQPRNNKARAFQATMKWRSTHSVTRLLSDLTDKNAPADVSYIPQSYLEEICNEVNDLPGSAFDRELKSVIFSHVSEEEKLGTQTLDRLIEFRTEPLEERLGSLRLEMSELNKNIAALEQQCSDTNRQLLLNLKAGKGRELEAHDALKPAEIVKPDADPLQQVQMESIGKKIEAANKERDAVAEAIRGAEAHRSFAAKQIASVSRIRQHLRNFEATYNSFLLTLNGDCEVLGLSPKELVRVTVNSSAVDEAAQAATTTSAAQEQIIAAGLVQTSELKTMVDSLTEQLDAPNSAHQRYVEALRAWVEKREAIVGTQDKRETLAYLERQIEELDQLPSRLSAAKEARKEKVKEIFQQIEAMVLVYRTLYHPVQEFIMRNQVANQKFHLEFDASVVSVNLDDLVLGKVNQSRKGSFSGVEEGKRSLKTLIATADFQTSDGVAGFADELMERFYADYRYAPPTAVALQDQLRQSVDPAMLMDAVYGLEYLQPKYQLKWSGKSIEELSPGERGTLLLIFYLLIDRRDIPLIIDQPEDNLDNQTVYDMLVACLREARKRRQVIIVTHNPNLAVVCDADQIIHSHIDKQGKNKVTYTGGSLENPVTNKFSIMVLEGTRPAFVQRDRKYQDD